MLTFTNRKESIVFKDLHNATNICPQPCRDMHLNYYTVSFHWFSIAFSLGTQVTDGLCNRLRNDPERQWEINVAQIHPRIQSFNAATPFPSSRTLCYREDRSSVAGVLIGSSLDWCNWGWISVTASSERAGSRDNKKILGEFAAAKYCSHCSKLLKDRYKNPGVQKC